jgi:tryptophanyl-tRNA synthetase
MDKEIVLTGLRTNAEYHLGNYLGAILPMVERANNLAGKYQINLFAPDLHSFTTPIDHSKLYVQTMHNLKLFVAAGLPLDNPDVFIYRQSFIPAHSELAVILDNFTYFGELGRMIQFKDKSSQNQEVTAGLYTYPVLMAADILLYGAKWVPVGDDQTQHLEFARDIAQRMNNKFGNLFVVPESVEKQHEFVGKSQGTRIRSLRNPENKMSKSVDDPAGTIQLSDKPEEAAKKVMSATTDSFGEIKFDFKERPGISNLLQILSLLQGQSLQQQSLQQVIDEWQGKTSYG